ncbi:uncharacterized protein K460DRAFT_366056 [Cucurbitaria berberidis CBS 394.84]|uniref:Uncharacterized protein n=1 Tax=Cucurbitaria berberidis CBS 394.84 TaxID=1168544 RepID=A0A9P4GH65_9PLEO|nr:uncharacterized protein K460DRAFT_366056 [Cucurbitaria berberidis CBS 394.84]KAF1845169.1 hypothetical protein K460DRAFT_366056 [Cucurbitaria berberidis CBS 394.84]
MSLLLVMSTEPPPPMDRLTPSWMRRSKSRQKQPTQGEDVRPTTSNGLLSPRSASVSSNSDDSRSARSSKPGRRASIQDMVKRLRSPSNASIASNQSQDMEFNEIDNWFYGFRKYNRFVTTRNLAEQACPSQEFSKATKALTKNCGGQFLHGLPEAAFDFSLLWCPAGKLSRKNANEPTWSWAAYEGPVNFPFDPTSCPDVYTAPISDGEWFRSEIVNLHVGPEASPYTVRREKNSLRIKYPPYFHAPRGSDSSIESNTLSFTTTTIPAAGFTAEPLQYQGKEIPCSQLLNDKQQHCGVIMDFESSISESSPTGPFEFVLLSRNLRREPGTQTRKPVVPTMHPSGTPIWDGDHFVWDEEVADFDDELFEAGPWKMLNVMLIKWVGEHAERVAIARIHEDVWKQQSPVKKDIVLR